MGEILAGFQIVVTCLRGAVSDHGSTRIFDRQGFLIATKSHENSRRTSNGQRPRRLPQGGGDSRSGLAWPLLEILHERLSACASTRWEMHIERTFIVHSPASGAGAHRHLSKNANSIATRFADKCLWYPVVPRIVGGVLTCTQDFSTHMAANRSYGRIGQT